MYKNEILENAVKIREQEIIDYQINIDNYTLALEEISKLDQDEQIELSDFADKLKNLLASEKLEQKKSKIMLVVLQKQI